MDYRARFFSPSLGRFLQPDTLIPNAQNPQAFNRFSYVDNNPVNFNDPTGHKKWKPREDKGRLSGFQRERQARLKREETQIAQYKLEEALKKSQQGPQDSFLESVHNGDEQGLEDNKVSNSTIYTLQEASFDALGTKYGDLSIDLYKIAVEATVLAGLTSEVPVLSAVFLGIAALATNEALEAGSISSAMKECAGWAPQQPYKTAEISLDKNTISYTNSLGFSKENTISSFLQVGTLKRDLEKHNLILPDLTP